MTFKPAHKDTETPPGQFRYNEWWKEYNSVNGCPPAHVVGEAAYRQGWADAMDEVKFSKWLDSRSS